MDEIEIPEYFICPISLQIMKDPVTAVTGITYDRDSIEHWLFTTKNGFCPVTKQPLPIDSDLTPNLTLRRLIQFWCSENSSSGVDRIPTPKPPINKFHIVNLLNDLFNPQLQQKSLTQLELIAAENERNRKYMVEAGAVTELLLFILKCFKNQQIHCLEEALRILSLIRITSVETEKIHGKIDSIIDSLIWIIRYEMANHVSVSMKSQAVFVLKSVLDTASSTLLARLKPEFFSALVEVLRKGITQQATISALKILLDTCPLGRNRMMMLEAGAVFELVEIELGSPPEKRTTELILGILFQLCSCADGRAEFLSHKGSMAVISKRILTVSGAADDRAILIIWLIWRFSGTKMVVQEMYEVGTVSKLCGVLQAECATFLKEKAREILKAHTEEWKSSPCLCASLHSIRS